MATPQPIPIIYTGKEVAAPNWNEFNRSFNARMAQLSQQRQQQRQFDTLQKERRREEFLDSLDVDKLNSTNELLLSKKYEVTKGLEDYYTQTLQAADGAPSDKDLLQARMLGGRANQEIAKLNNWAKNQQIDLKAAENNLDIYDQDKVKEKIYDWNPDRDGAYNKSKLSETYRDVSVEEVRARRFQKMKDPNYFATTAQLSGKTVNGQKDYDEVYYDIEDGKITPDYGAQVGFLKAQTIEEDQMGVLSEIAYDKQFAQASAEDQKLYKDKAKRFTGREDDAKYIYELDQADGKYFESGEFEAEKEEKIPASERDKRDVIDVRKTSQGSFRTDPVGITGTITFISEDGEEKTFNAGRNAVQLTEIKYEENPKTGTEEWMVSGILKRNPTEEEALSGDIFARTVNEPIKIPYTQVKEDIDKKYNILLPVETKKKKAY